MGKTAAFYDDHCFKGMALLWNSYLLWRSSWSAVVIPQEYPAPSAVSIYIENVIKTIELTNMRVNLHGLKEMYLDERMRRFP